MRSSPTAMPMRLESSQSPGAASARHARTEHIGGKTAEAAIYAGEQTYAISLLKPIQARDGSDCPARRFSPGLCGAGSVRGRDAEIAALNKLHKQASEWPIGNLDTFLLESAA